MSKSTYRLPTHVSPRRYDVELEAEIGRENFNGQVNIALELHQESDTIDLHARDLDVSNVHLLVNGESYPATVLADPDHERIVLQFSQTFPAGEASLQLAFRGKVSHNLRGLYLAQNKPEQILCTQSASADARAIFPCFDEPAFKAQFAYKVTTPDPVVLTNSPLLSVKDNGATKTWEFAPTKTMSSYLTAIVIGDMAATETRIVNSIPLQVWTMRGKEQLGMFALEYATRLLPWYEQYFGIPYHFDKYDQVAVPGFALGAMENSGLVVFRQELLIMAAENSSWKQEKSTAHIVAHEFAHMWFGNLVTMQWWDDLWLNEAFAEWISQRAISEISPEYQVWNDFQEVQDTTFAADALVSTHPIYCPVQTPDEALELFDAITYQKGCGVLHMMENFLGSDIFREGLRSYMQEFAERNACGSDLWRHLEAASRQPVTEIMESWILQGGFPCVTAALLKQDETVQLQLKQKRFLTNPKASSAVQQLWQIPLLLRYADDTGIHEFRHILPDASGTLLLPVQGDLHWCTLNADQIGFYRQNVDEVMFQKLLSHLDQLNAREQMGLLSDQWALAQSGDRFLTRFLEVLQALAFQTDSYNLISRIVAHLVRLEQMVEDLDNPALMERFRQWVRMLFQERLNRLGVEPRTGESVNIATQRISVISAMAALAHDPQIIAQVGIWGEREAMDPQAVDPNLADTVAAINAQFGDEQVFQKYVHIYHERKASGARPQTISRYLDNFASFRAPGLPEKTLDLLEEGIVPQDSGRRILNRMLTLRHAQLAAWQYLKQNWLTIKDLGYGPNGLIRSAGNLPASMRSDLVEFCEANVRGVADMSYAQALETMDLRAEFLARTKAELTDWLTNFQSEKAEQ